MAEFNVFGFGYGHMARFNYDPVPDPQPDPVASVLVRTNINYGGPTAPNCIVRGFSAESNDLNYVGDKPSFGQNGPALRFWQSGRPGVEPHCNLPRP